MISDERKPHPSDVLILLGKLHLQRNGAVRRLAAVAGEHELDRYARLAGGGARRLPVLRRAAADAEPARELVVFPLASSPINHWPLSAMGAAALRVAAEHAMDIVLIGGEKDRPGLEGAVAGGTFGPRAQVVVGSPEDLPAVAARIAGAAGYLGIETGLVHLAAAYGIPGATAYGGGYWPVYGPWAARSAAVVAPIPCFGCEWDCAFGRPFCLEGIDAGSVVAAFEGALANEGREPLVRTIEPYGEREHAIFGTAAAVHRAAQRDRSARLTAITRLRDMLARYARRSRARGRKADAALAALADTTARAARRLDEARKGDRTLSSAGRPPAEQ